MLHIMDIISHNNGWMIYHQQKGKAICKTFFQKYLVICLKLEKKHARVY